MSVRVVPPGQSIGPGTLSPVLDSEIGSLIAAAVGSVVKAPSAASYPYLHRALGRVRGAVADGKLLIVGDSTAYGHPQLPGRGPVPAMVKAFAGAGVNAAPGLVLAPYYSETNPDTRWTAGSGWTLTGSAYQYLGLGFGGLSTSYTAPAGTSAALSFAPGISCDHFDVYYITGAGPNGTMQANVDGGSNTPIVTNGAVGIAKTTIAAGSVASNHVLNLGTVTVGAVFVVGVEAWLSTTPTLRVANAGVDTTTTANWTSTAGAPAGPLNAIELYAPDVTVIALGVNDAGLNSATTGTYLANVATIAAAAKVSGDVFVASPVPSEQIMSYPLEAGYTAALPAFCSSSGFGLIDLFDRWGGINAYAALEPLGFYNTDGLHPEPLGYADMGAAYAAALLTA